MVGGYYWLCFSAVFKTLEHTLSRRPYKLDLLPVVGVDAAGGSRHCLKAGYRVWQITQLRLCNHLSFSFHFTEYFYLGHFLTCFFSRSDVPRPHEAGWHSQQDALRVLVPPADGVSPLHISLSSWGHCPLSPPAGSVPAKGGGKPARGA